MALGWESTVNVGSRGWTCGYCGKNVGGSVGYRHRVGDAVGDKLVYICPHCENPTAFIMGDDGEFEQYPGAVRGNEVGSLPESVGALYEEVRRCIQYTAYTSAVLSMRKLLMHVAVDKGAAENLGFVEYVEYLESNGWIPPTGREWVDEIRKAGNEAAHEIDLVTEADACDLLDLVEMTLRIVYELPARKRRK